MNKNYILNCFAVAAFSLANTMGAMAAPLLKGTKLSITQGETISAEVPCTIGSCFGIEYSPGLYIWQNISPGTDGGFIVGKAQKCETAPPGPLPYIIPGELTSSFQFHGQYIGSFCTDPGGELNLFDDTKCIYADCLGKTELKNFYVADLAGNKSSLSNNAEVQLYVIEPVTNGFWSMDYKSLISAGPGQNVGFRLLMRGKVTLNSVGALPPGTLLTIDPGEYDFEGNCGPAGSCLSIWWGSRQFVTGLPLSPGTDGGIVIGKNQLPGGQQLYSPTENAMPGELSAASLLAGRRATVATAPFSGLDQNGLVTRVTTDAARNIFGRSSCVGQGCLGRTELGTWHLAMGGLAIPLGSAEGCHSVNCTTDQLLGIGVRSWTVFPDGRYQLNYTWVIPDDYPFSRSAGTLAGVPVTLRLSGKIILPGNTPPVVADVNMSTVSAQTATWQPVIKDINGDPTVCRLGLLPANGTATVNADCSSGTYQSEPGFIGADSFTYIANDGQYDSNPGTVTVAVSDGSVDQICVKNNPLSQFIQTGKEGTLTIAFTGNITSHTNKEVKVCPGTTLSYKTASTKGPVVCQVKNNTAAGSGRLKINDHIKCTDKPAGKDKVYFKVKSGINK